MMKDSTKIKAPKIWDYLELTKPRLTFLVALSSFTGFYLGSVGNINFLLMVHTLLSILLASGGACTLNQVIERNFDAKMSRTKNRPLPGKRLNFKEALTFGIAISLISVFYLAVFVNFLTSLLVAFTIVSYLFAYTPLKRISTLNTFVGAVIGAIPIVCGWTAAQNTLNIECTMLFGILFLWQFPHFLAIAIIYRKDYVLAGYKMLPTLKNGLKKTNRLIIITLSALLLISTAPTFLGLTGYIYLSAALILGGMFWGFGVSVVLLKNVIGARRLMMASFIYPLLLWGFMIFDKVSF